jgi:polyhydroxyalkanoate synthase
MSDANGSACSQAPQALLDEWIANARRAARLPRVVAQAQRVKKGATPSEVVFEEDRIKLLHYIPESGPGDGNVKYRTPLIFVFALVNRPYILDILPNKSVVSHFVKAGFDTYLIDWGVATDADRHLSLDDYINSYLRTIVKHVRRRSGAKQVSLLGYCMGGTMSTMFTALHQEYVKNLILLAAGIDFSTRQGLLNLWSDANVFDVDAFVDEMGNCPAEFLQGCFQMLSPVRNLIGKPITLMERMDDEKFLEEFLTMENWINDNVPVPGEVFRDFVKSLYQQNLLVKNQMRVGREIVDLRRITCPVLNLLASQDTLVPASQSEPFTELVGSMDKETIELPTGHIGLAMGSAAQRELWPKAVAWLAERSN